MVQSDLRKSFYGSWQGAEGPLNSDLVDPGQVSCLEVEDSRIED